MRAGWSIPLVCCALAACTSFHGVESTPEGIRRDVEPGDVVRVTARGQDSLRLLVWSVSAEDIRGRTSGPGSEVVRVRLDRIETIEVQRLNLKKTILTTVVPVIVAAAIVCGREDCDTGGAVVGR